MTFSKASRKALSCYAALTGGVHVPKMLVGIGLANSLTDAERKLEEGAVKINGIQPLARFYSPVGNEKSIVVRVGRKWKRVQL